MKKQKMKAIALSKSKGFTLIEVVVVMAIIAVLAVLIVGAITVARNTATETTNRTNAKTMQAALEASYSKNRSYPTISNVSFKALGTEGATVGTGGPTGWSYPSVTKTCTGNMVPGTGTAVAADNGGIVNSTTTGYTIYVADKGCTAETSTSDRLSGP